MNELLKNVRKLKKIPRTGWVRNKVPNPESVADHSYEVALIVSIIADELNLDHSKLVRAALVHDLGESVTGDIARLEKTPEHEKAEREALEKILDAIPESKEKYLEPLTEKEQAVIYFADILSRFYQAEEYNVQNIRDNAEELLMDLTSRFPEFSKFWQKS